MGLRVVGAGVGRTGTHSLKLALEQLVGGRCHHMMEVMQHQEQIPGWIDAVEGRPVDWSEMLADYRSPGRLAWSELLAGTAGRQPRCAGIAVGTRPRAVVPECVKHDLFASFDHVPPVFVPWMTAVRQLMHDRFSDRFDDATAMIDAYERHNAAVRRQVPPGQLLEWTPADGWEPICERLSWPIPADPFPVTNTTDDFRAMLGMPALS